MTTADLSAKKPDTELLTASQGVRIQSLVFIRWLAVLGQAFAIFLVQWGMHYDIPLIPAFLLVGASAVVNILVTLSYKSTARLSDGGAILYLVYDALQLSGLLYLTGGLTNPFAILFLVPVTISATNLSLRGTIFLGVTTLVCISFLAVYHEPLPLQGTELKLTNTYILATWSALVLGTIFLSGYAWRISSDGRAMNDALTAARLALAREQQLSAVGGIAAAAAHELGTPLNTILLVSKELSRELPEGSEFAEDAHLLHNQAKKCAEVLEQLSKGPSSNRFLQRDAHHNYLPFQSLMSLVVDKNTDMDTGIEVVIETNGDLDNQPKLYATPEILYSLGNLVSNAAEFARKKVTLSLYWDLKAVRATIQDDGPGFSEEILARLGEPYTSSRAGRGGMGLGVFISEMLIRHSGGNIRFGNAKEGGARVTIEWSRGRLEKENPYG
ncbi:ActS/PrrB/RegB family redox-sensitive histidine kinase [Sneathiella chinensis]|uniref:histidine kinase n=1 Tax=Sneathiella chinensis TaxID=349750 RepID=A0ABQ5U337_9PROT|nr:ActS/PrrB/RegB family redox-sensitive histidine kinase [Sneathiella chinensis]GLQ04916.1 ATPase [Sneathiella chinensis]